MKRMTEEGETQLPAIFRRAKEKGVITSMDMSFPDPASSAARAPWKTILSAALPYVDIFLPSIEEILLLLNRPLYDQMFQQSNNGDILPLITPEFLSTISQQLLEMGAKVVGFKCGYRGLYLRTADFSSIKALSQVLPIKSEEWAAKEHWEPCFKVNVVGTAGSGDATIAGFLCALLHGFSLEKAAEAAVAVGACCVEAADTVSGIRSWEETLKRIESGWQKLSL
jgi:sugar/nucleoside kinase (ribokinase family)